MLRNNRVIWIRILDIEGYEIASAKLKAIRQKPIARCPMCQNHVCDFHAKQSPMLAEASVIPRRADFEGEAPNEPAFRKVVVLVPNALSCRTPSQVGAKAAPSLNWSGPMAALYLALSIPAFNFLGALSSLLAAFHWYRASQVKDSPEALLGSFGWAGPDNAPNAGVDATPLVEYAQVSGRRNKIAALWGARQRPCSWA